MPGQRYSGKILRGVLQFLFKRPGFAAKFASCLRGGAELLSGDTILTTEYQSQ